jgi:DDE superfamily endonuclease.
MECFDNYECALRCWEFSADRVYNINETGESTVVQSPNSIAQFGTKQVGQAASDEQGTMITICMIISSVGNTLPPVFIFPRARLQDSLRFGAPPGRLGLVNSPQSSRITEPLFLKVLEHVKKHTRSSKEDRTILLMVNHKSHCSLDSNL